MTEKTSKKKTKILIVEDESILAKSLEDALINMDYEVAGIADSGVKAISTFFFTKPDLILMDIRLKGPLNGVETAEKIRHQHSVPIVFLTGNQDPLLFEKAKIEGAYGYVLKPYQERELQIVIEVALTQFEEQRKRDDLQKSLMIAEKLSTVGLLASGIIHDISNPLSIIKHASTLLAEGRIDESRPGRTMKDVSDKLSLSIQSLEAVIKNYRTMMDSSDHEAVCEINVFEVCKQALNLCQHLAASKKIKFNELNSEKSVTALVGRTSMIQVLVNLIKNACDAVAGTDDAWINISWQKVSENQVFIRLTDSGKGIPTEHKEKLFKPLVTSKPVGAGTGLGLVLCRTLLQKFSASLNLVEDSQNTTFQINLKS